MPISATGIKRGLARCRPHEAGFSLVEVLVVVVLIGLMSTVVVLNLPHQPQGPEREAQALAARLRMAAEDSITTGRLLGARVGFADAGFYRLREGQWQPLEGDRMLAPLSWPAGTVVHLARPADSANSAEAPAILFDPLGGVTPFAIVLERGGVTKRVVGTGDGHVRVEDGNV